MIVYGPRPGTVVKFPLTIEAPRSVPDGNGGVIALPEKTGVKGDTVTVTAKVPSEADRRELDRPFAGASLARVGAEQVQIRTTADALEEHQRAVITKLLVRLDDYSIEDPNDPNAPPFEIHTPEEVVTFCDRDVLNAIVGVLMDRLRLTEVLRGNSGGRSPSSTAAILPPGGTAANAGSSGSVESERVIAPPKTPAST